MKADHNKSKVSDLGRMTSTARPALSLTDSLNCLPVTASGSTSAQVIASGLYVLRLQETDCELNWSDANIVMNLR